MSECSESKQSGPTHYYDQHSQGSFIVYFAFGPPSSVFNIYRSLLSIDSTHLFEKYKDTLLIATRVDVEDGLYSLAFAVVEGETQAAWHWFISRIYDLIPRVHQDRIITFIFDWHKGIPNMLA